MSDPWDIDAHRATTHISVDQYVKQRSVELGQSLGDRFALYLDQNFWIAVRNADNGSGTELENELLRMLRELAREGAIFCPISETVLVELLKQDDVQSRLSTARLIDDLSLGVSLIPYDMRAGTELAHVIHRYNSDPGTLHPVRRHSAGTNAVNLKPTICTTFTTHLRR